MPSPSTPTAKTERLLNLVLVLLYTRRPLTRAQLRAAVPQYGQGASEDTFSRMFERDKDELRELGIPLVTESLGSAWHEDEGYRIHQRDYALPDIDFEPDEMAALGLAARAWAAASLAGPAAQALRKLRASGVERDEESLIGVEPRLRTVEPAFDAVKDAVTRRVPVAFDYRRPGAPLTSRRQVQPWALLSWHGHWYLTAHDLARDAPRVFRLSRIEGQVRAAGPPGSYQVPEHDARAMVAVDPPSQATSAAVLRIRSGRGHLLRRRARTVEALSDGWDRVSLDLGDLAAGADEITAHGSDVIVEQPPELTTLVRDRLQAVIRAHGGAP